MKRGAIVSALSCATLIATACTNDFDGLFGPADDFTDDKTGGGGSSSSGGGGGTKPDPNGACGKGRTTCEAIPSKGDLPELACKGCCTCGSEDGPLECASAAGCAFRCFAGASCTAACIESEDDCTFTTDASESDSTCAAGTCTLACTNGSVCALDCTGASAGGCTARCDATSSCTVTCGPGELKGCNVECDGRKRVCADGTVVCNAECPS